LNLIRIIPAEGTGGVTLLSHTPCTRLRSALRRDRVTNDHFLLHHADPI
jgi:hypothetical protein